MPVASGVALTWGDYTTLPLAGNMIFYWWTPDPTFLHLNPMILKFAQNKPEEHVQGNLVSENAAIPINKLVSRDLDILAPIVERFSGLVDLPMAEMDNMLMDHMDKGLDFSEESWRNVTCTWLRNNRALWQQWIPDETVCARGFGLYDSELKQFTDDRNVTNKIVCQAAHGSKTCAPRKWELKHQPRFVEWLAPVGEGFVYCLWWYTLLYALLTNILAKKSAGLPEISMSEITLLRWTYSQQVVFFKCV